MLKEKIQTWLMYAASFLLVTGYCMILAKAVYKPEVCEEYRKYYITEELADWPGYGGLDYTLAAPLVFTNDLDDADRVKRRGGGWGELQEDGCYIAEREAVMYFRNLPENTLRMEAEIEAYQPSVRIEVLANKKSVGSISPAQGQGSYMLNIPKDVLSDGGLDLVFRLEGGAENAGNWVKFKKMRITGGQ